MWARVFAIDYRSLRLFRGFLGLIVLADAFYRSPMVQSMYSDDGVFPRFLLAKTSNSASRLTLLALSGHWFWAAALIMAMAALGVLLFFNVRTRAVSLGLFVILVSLENRNPAFAFGFDQLLRTLVFWSILLPGKGEPGRSGFSSAVSVGVFLQLAVIYICAGWLKSADDWLWHPDASFSALSNHFYGTDLGAWLTHFHGFLKVSTVAVFMVERFGWLLFFSPWKTERLRLIGCLLFIFLHAGFGTILDICLFALADIGFIVLFLPTEFWTALSRPFKVEMTPARWIPSGAWRTSALAVFLVLVFWGPLSEFHEKLAVPRRLRSTVRDLGFQQSWSMFAPMPMEESGWLIPVGIDYTGRSVDVLHFSEQSADMNPTGSFIGDLPHRRWLDFLAMLAVSDRKTLRKLYADYLCREWQAQRHSLLKRVDLYFYAWYHRSPEKAKAPTRRLIASRMCDEDFKAPVPIPTASASR